MARQNLVMSFEIDKSTEKIGKKAGFVLSCLVFATVLYLLLNLSHKLPASWTYVHILGITILIALIGIAINKALK